MSQDIGPATPAGTPTEPSPTVVSTRHLLTTVDRHETNLAADALSAAIRAVLDVHQSAPDMHYWADPGWCIECANVDLGVAWPCPTVRVIAAELGVEL